jgi:hypothetical protein
MEPIAKLVSTRPDADIAADIRAKMESAYAPVLRILDEATAAGFQVTCAAGPDYAGRHQIVNLTIAKVYR